MSIVRKKIIVTISLFAVLSNGCNAESWAEYALFKASGYGYSRIVKALLYFGVDPYAINSDKKNAFIEACSSGNTEVAKLFLNADTKPRDIDTHAQLALLCASKKGQIGTMQLLIDRGTPIDTSFSCKPPISLAASNGHSKAVRLLLRHGSNCGNLVLLRAAQYGHVDTVRLLLGCGVLPSDQEINQALSDMAKIELEIDAAPSNIPSHIIQAIWSGQPTFPLSDNGKHLIQSNLHLYEKNLVNTKKALSKIFQNKISEDSEYVVLEMLYGKNKKEIERIREWREEVEFLGLE